MTDSAEAAPAGGTPVVVHTTERVGTTVPAALRAERRAWLILWLAFATFCAVVFAAIKFTLDYVSTAEVHQSARVVASRGQVVFSLPGSVERTLIGSRSDLGVGTVVSIDRTTVAFADLQFFDGSKIKVLDGASLELSRMEVGRFVSQQSLVLTQTSGPIHYATGGPVDVQIPRGVVHLAPRGDYTIWLLDRDLTTRILVYGGEARVSVNGANVTVTDGHRVEIDTQGRLGPVVDRQMPLLANSDFSKHEEGWEPWDQLGLALDTKGNRFWVDGPEEGSTALRVVRESAKGEHGETGAIQKLKQDVSGFRHLWLQALVRVDYADLSGGGQLGSEYPMMLRLQYEGPVDGSRPDWAVGFYYSNRDNRHVPEHLGVPWPQGEWKPYQVDLMKREPPDVPYRLIEFAVMAQGHSYDARIANISLVGD